MTWKGWTLLGLASAAVIIPIVRRKMRKGSFNFEVPANFAAGTNGVTASEESLLQAP